jgi:nitrogen regulatory protein P-II 1
MKMVIAIIRPEKLPVVRKALEDVGIGGLTISQVAGHGAQGGVVQQWRGNAYTVDLLQKVKLEIVVPNPKLEPVLSAIRESAATGAVGDGKVFVIDVEDVMRVRTGERGEAAV